MLRLILLLLFVPGCVVVQPASDLIDPVQVFIGDYGIHSSLFLPTQDGRYVEYAFGDWQYAVEGKNSSRDAAEALVASKGAGLGRQYHPAVGGIPAPKRQPLALHAVTCDRPDVSSVIDRLDVRYETLRAKNGEMAGEMSWVREDDCYSLLNNCNHLTARTLEALGCQVYGIVVWSKFAVLE